MSRPALVRSTRQLVVACLLLATAFAMITWNVVAGVGLARMDPTVERSVVGHRVGWETGTLKVLTWLGSGVILWPLVGAVAVGLVLRSRRWGDGAFLVLALAGSVVLAHVVKPVMDRPRPPTSLVHVTGSAYPSGHAMDSLAAYAALAVVVTAGRTRRHRTLAALTAGIAVAVVGWSRLYLGAHWLSDVLGGFGLSALWVSVLLLAFRLPTGPARIERYPPARDR